MRVGIVRDNGGYSRLFPNDSVINVETIGDIKNCNLVLFTGGEDVGSNPDRDIEERSYFYMCQMESIPVVGICRGMQFLAWAHSVPLIQHIDGHNSCMHEVQDWRGRKFNVKGDHHQAVKFVDDGRVDVLLQAPDGTVESCFFPSIKGFGVQYHPEWMEERSIGYRWFQSRLKEFTS
jgi:N5-(cytidine 5'-diphosphoramidyl)-L-glutamine hydrolase